MRNKLNNINLYKLISNRTVFLIILNILVFIIMSLISPYYFSVDTILSMTKYGVVIALISLGQSLVILGGGGGIDLSLGSNISLSGILLGILVNAGVNIWFACILTIMIGVFLGSIHGVLVAYGKLPAFAVTLGGLYTYGALAMVLTDGIPISNFPEVFSVLGQGTFLNIPNQVIFILIPIFIILNWVLNNTVFGRSVYLVGINDEAANLSGVNVEKIRTILFSISGGLGAVAAIVMTSWIMTARPNAGYGLELQAVTVAVLGGIHIFGGKGTLSGTMLSALIITNIGYGLQIANINTTWQLAILGILLLGAVLLNKLVGEE